MFKFIAVAVVLVALTEAAPKPDDGIPPLFTFENGNVGVNFLGFKASAGLGGLLTGNAADGGLHAEAGTPFGQAAGAGLGGRVDGNGRSAGGLYAGATAGGGVSAGAGLGGVTGSSGSAGASFAGSSNGGSGSQVIKYKSVGAPVVGIHKEVYSAGPVYQKQVEVVEAKPQTTLVERTVIPNYVEKTVHVPSYVEKTVRVPTVVEKRIKVPAEPTIIEKTVSSPAKSSAVFETRFAEEAIAPGSIKVVEKIHHHPHHHKVHYRKYVNYGYPVGGVGYGAVGYGAGGVGGGDAHYSATVTKTANPQLFNDIFNIPISTLGAVNRLLNGISGGTSGSVAVSKHVSF